MNSIKDETLAEFLDDFMHIEYRGKDHIIARQHYREVFNDLIPRYFENNNEVQEPLQSKQSESTGNGNIVIIGAGYGGLTAALRLEKYLRKDCRYKIHLIDKNPYHTIKTQLHEAAVRKEEVPIPLDRILRKKNISFHIGTVINIDIKHKQIEMDSKFIGYDFLVIAIGSKVNYYDIPGMEEHSLPLQTLQDADKIYNHISKICAQTASENDSMIRKNKLRFVIGGGGLSGVEFAGELADHTSACIKNYNVRNDELEIIIIEAADRLVPFMEPGYSQKIKEKLINKGVRVLTKTKIARRTKDEIVLADGKEIKTKNFIWTGGIRVSELLKNGGLETDQTGKVIVDEHLHAKSDNNIYVIGDSANAINPYTGKTVPAAAQFALQQGRVVAINIFSETTGRQKKKYYPKVTGEVVSLGKHLAIGWMALPLIKKVTFVGFLGRLLKAAIKEKHIFLLRKESRNWITY